MLQIFLSCSDVSTSGLRDVLLLILATFSFLRFIYEIKGYINVSKVVIQGLLYRYPGIGRCLNIVNIEYINEKNLI